MAKADVQRFIELEALHLGLDPALALSLAQQESDFDPHATSETGVQGLFQVTKPRYREYGGNPNNRTDPVESTQIGLRYFRDLLHESGGDVRQALMRYNGGSDPTFDTNVLRHYQQFAGKPHPSLVAARSSSRGGAGSSSMTREQMEERLRQLDAVSPLPSSGVESSPVPIPQEPLPAADLTVNIEKESTPRELIPDAEIARRIDEGLAEAKARTDAGTAALPGVGIQMGGGIAGALGGASLGGRIAGAPGAIAGGILGSIGGGSLGTRLSNWLNEVTGLSKPEEPMVTGSAVNLYPSDLLGAAGAVVPYAPQLFRAATRRLSRAGRALSAADQKTMQQLDEYRTAYNQRAADAEAAYETQRFDDLLAVSKDVARQKQAAQRAAQRATDTAQEEFRRASVTDIRQWAKGQSYLDMQAEEAAQKAGTKAMEAWETDVAKKTQRWADDTWKAYADWEASEEALKETLRTGNARAYEEAVQVAKQRQRTFREQLTSRDKDMQAHMAMVKRLQALPESYMPRVPGRTLADVDRDLGFLAQGGKSADTVTQRLGAEDIFDAQALLQQERATLGAAGETPGMPGPGRTAPPPRDAGAATPDVDPLLSFVRQGKGIRLEGEELASDFEGVIRNRESGTTGLFNNQSGQSADQVAQDAFDAGLLDSPDTHELLRRLDDALRGRGSQARGGVMPEAPDFPPEAPTPRRTAGRGERPPTAADMAYQRLDDMSGASEVDLSPALDAAASAKAQFGEGMAALQDARVRKILTDLTAEDVTVDGTMSQVVSDVRALTRAMRTTTNSDVKYYLSQVIDGFDEAVRASALRYPETTGKSAALWDEARQLWRHEQAVDEVANMLKPSGGGVLQYKRNDQGDLVLVANPTKLFNELQAAMSGKGAKAKSFLARGGLPDAEATQLLAEVESLARTPEMPLQRPKLPPPVEVQTQLFTPTEAPTPAPFPDIGMSPAPTPPAYTALPMPVPGQGLPPAVPMAPVRVPQPPPRQRPPGEPYAEPPPVEPVTPSTGVRQALGELGGAYALGTLTGFPVLPLAVTYDIADRVFAWVMLQPQLRPLLRSMIKPGGEIDPAMVGFVAGLMRRAGHDPGGALPSPESEQATPERR